MSTVIEITKEAFESIIGDSQPIISMSAGSGAEIYRYMTKGVVLESVTNYYSKAITQYYIQDINA